jgi:tetratricopeptide (TPR) repeat protein
VASVLNFKATLLLDAGYAAEALQLTETLHAQLAQYSDARLIANVLDKLAMAQLACGQVAAARATLGEALDSPMVKNDFEYQLRFKITEAVAYLMAGDLDQAVELLKVPMPNAPARTLLERDLVRAVAALLHGEVTEAQAQAGAVAEQARAAGTLIIAQRAERVSHCAEPPPLPEIPQLVWM